MVGAKNIINVVRSGPKVSKSSRFKENSDLLNENPAARMHPGAFGPTEIMKCEPYVRQMRARRP